MIVQSEFLKRLFGIPAEGFQLFIGMLRTHQFDQFHLVELMDAVEAPDILAV